MELGLGHLQIQPDQFWRLSPREFFAAVDGYLKRIGARPADEPLTRDKVRDLFAEHERRMAAANPGVLHGH